MGINETRERVLAVEVKAWGIDDEPVPIRGVAKSWFRAGWDAALSSVTVEQITEALKATFHDEPWPGHGVDADRCNMCGMATTAVLALFTDGDKP